MLNRMSSNAGHRTRFAASSPTRTASQNQKLLKIPKLLLYSNVPVLPSPANSGADPAFDVFKLGEEMGFRPGAKLKYMALGQGMGPKAQEFIETGCARGLWIMLQVWVDGDLGGWWFRVRNQGTGATSWTQQSKARCSNTRCFPHHVRRFPDLGTQGSFP